MQHFTLFNVIAFSIRENNNQEIQRYNLHKEVNHQFLGISKLLRKIMVQNDYSKKY